MGRSTLSRARLILVITILLLGAYTKYQEAQASHHPPVATAGTANH